MRPESQRRGPHCEVSTARLKRTNPHGAKAQHVSGYRGNIRVEAPEPFGQIGIHSHKSPEGAANQRSGKGRNKILMMSLSIVDAWEMTEKYRTFIEAALDAKIALLPDEVYMLATRIMADPRMKAGFD